MLNQCAPLLKATDSPPAAMSNRHQILQQLLENKAGLQIDELVKFLNISRTAVQKHILMLEKEDFIKKHTRLKTLGRPSTRYVLTDKGMAYFPKSYTLFSEFFLRELKDEIGSDQFMSYMQKLGKIIARQYRSRFAELSEKKQLDALFVLLQEFGFYPSWVEHPETENGEINAHNCIFYEIAQKIPEVCIFDLALMEELLNKKIELRSCMALGDEVCCFKSSSSLAELNSHFGRDTGKIHGY
jgi:DeoR family suf operon transcriptional repressor